MLALCLLLLASPVDLAGLPDAVRPLDASADRGRAESVDDWGTDELMWTDDTDVDPYASADPDMYAGLNDAGDAGRGPTLPGAPAPIPVDGGLGVLALAGVAFAARRLRKRVTAPLVALALAFAAPASAQTLAPGDIAIVSFNTNFTTNTAAGAEGFKAVALVNLPAGTVVRFTDRGVTTTGAFRAATGTELEGTTTFTAPAAIAAGTVLTYNDTGTGTTAGFAPATAAFGGAGGLTAAGDQMIVYQGDDLTHTFVYAVTHNGGASAAWNADATSALTSAVPIGLSDGLTARSLTFQNSPYKGATTAGTRGVLLTAIGTLADWPGSNTLNSASSTATAAPAAYTVNAALASPTLSPGDIAFINIDTAYGASSNPTNGTADGFAFVTLVDLPEGCVIRFTDRGWTAAGAFRALVAGEAEGTTVYTAPTAIPAGTVVRYRDNGGTTNSAGFSPYAQAFGGLTLAGDQILAYQGTEAAPVFIHAVHQNPAGLFDADATSITTSAIPRGLDLGSTAVALAFDNNSYDLAAPGPGTAAGSRGALLLAIGSPANWNGSDVANSPNPNPYPPTFAVTGNATTGAATLVGGEGWRLLSVPSSTTGAVTVAQLRAIGLVQGLPDEYPGSAANPAAPNLYLNYNGYNADSGDPDGVPNTTAGRERRANNLGFVAPFDASPATQEDVQIRAGRGFIWYFYDRAFGPFAGGTSTSTALPLLLPMLGTELTANDNVVFTTADRTPAAASPGLHDGFYLIGNPYRQALDLSGISKAAAGTGTLQATFQFWNPNAGTTSPFGSNPGNGTPGSYVVRTATADAATNLVNDDAQVWQGFFAEIAGGSAASPPTFTFDATSRVTSSDPTFYGREAAVGSGPDSVRTVAFTVSGLSESGYGTFDEAALLRFSPDAALGWDRYEASKISPFGGLWATLSPVGPGYDTGEPVRLSQRSLPYSPAGPVAVPLAFEAAGEGGQYTLSWALQNVPAGWALSLVDTETQTTTDLQTATEYAFASGVADSERFVLTLTPGSATASDGETAPLRTEVGRFFPNPASGTARVHVRKAAGGRLRATLLDALGRRVQTVHDASVAAGAALDLRVETAALARGVYLLRVDGEGVSETRRLTVVR